MKCHETFISYSESRPDRNHKSNLFKMNRLLFLCTKLNTYLYQAEFCTLTNKMVKKLVLVAIS